MANFKHIGKDFIPHDVVAKVTGAAKYAEDFRADGMVFCKLLTSPMPHARVKNIDAAEALKMEGVLGMLTADDIPAGTAGLRAGADQGAAVRRRAHPRGRRGLASRPPKTPSSASRSTTSRCPSPSIRWRACFPAARTRAAMASTSARSQGLAAGQHQVDARPTSRE